MACVIFVIIIVLAGGLLYLLRIFCLKKHCLNLYHIYAVTADSLQFAVIPVPNQMYVVRFIFMIIFALSLECSMGCLNLFSVQDFTLEDILQIKGLC